MKEFVQETVSARFRQLPETVQDIILSDTLTSESKKVMDSAGLEGDTRKEFNRQVTLVLVGLSTTKDIKDYIFSDMKLEGTKAQTLYDTTVSNIILPVRDALLKSFDENKEREGVPTPTLQPTSSDPYRESHSE